MEIIIHGKPFDRSSRFTAGMDKVIAEKIIDDFFGNTAFKEKEVLVVDARYWNRKLVSVYTLWLGKSVKDMAENGGRDSYFAISLIIEGYYCSSVSLVYDLLEKIVRECVIGTYLNNNLRYIVHDFEDTSAFERLCSNLRSSYRNLEKAFDNSFQPQATFSNDTYYSIKDCDSLAFVDTLKKKGRIIVTENAETKDVLAAQSVKFRQEAQQAINELQTKKVKIAELEKRIAQREDTVRQADSLVSGKVRKLEEQIVSLNTENKRLVLEKENINRTLQELREKMVQAVSILGVTKQQTSSTEVRSKGNNKKSPSKHKNEFAYYLPAVNTLLILFMLVGLFLNLRRSSGDHSMEKNPDNAKIDSLEWQIAQRDKEIITLQEAKEQLEQSLNQYMDNQKNIMRNSELRSRQPAVSNADSKARVQPKAEPKEKEKKKDKNKNPNPKTM